MPSERNFFTIISRFFSVLLVVTVVGGCTEHLRVGFRSMILPNCERCLISSVSSYEWTRGCDVHAVGFFDVQIAQRRRVVTFSIDRVVRTKPSHQEVRTDRFAVPFWAAKARRAECNLHFSETPFEEFPSFAWESPARHFEEMAVASRGWRHMAALARNLVRSVWRADGAFGGAYEMTRHDVGSTTGGKRVAALETGDAS